MTVQGSNIQPVWSADGARIIFSSFESKSFDLYSIPFDGGAEPEELLVDAYGVIPTSVSGDDASIAYTLGDTQRGSDVYILSLGDEITSRPFLTASANEDYATISPAGRLVAYESDESGRYEIYVRPIDGSRGKSTVSTSGGRKPRWSSRGDELFFLNGPDMMAVDVELEPSFAPGTPRRLFEGRYGFDYDVTPDAQHFVMVTRMHPALTSFNVVTNWATELERLVPTSPNASSRRARTCQTEHHRSAGQCRLP